MDIWARLKELVGRRASDVGTFIERLVHGVRHYSDPQTRRQIAFTLAMIALSAKMAKADGVVTRDEIDAFRDLVAIPPGEEQNVSRIFNLAKQDIAGYEIYAGRLKTLFGDEHDILEDILDGLFHIAMADGVLHEGEERYIAQVAEIFAFTPDEYQRVRIRHVCSKVSDAYFILAGEPEWSDDALKVQYRMLVRQNHPDRLMARGVPQEFIKIASDKLATINTAWEQIKQERGIG